MWFCPMTQCARREGASPTEWRCLLSLVSNLSSVHLSTSVAPPDPWLDAHGLRVSLACQEISPKGARCPGTRCPTAVLAALSLDNTAPSALTSGRAPPGGPGPLTPTGVTRPHTAHGPYRGFLHVRPGTDGPAAGPGAVSEMGGPDAPSPLPPHCPRGTRTGWQGDEVLLDPAMPAQWPCGCHGPIMGRPLPRQTEPGRGPNVGLRRRKRLLPPPNPRTVHQRPSGPS